jgi:hypothetical protein
MSSRIRTLENRVNKLEVELEDLKTKIESTCLKEDEFIENIECQEQTIALKDSRGDKIIQLKDAITNFGNKYIVKLLFKENIRNKNSSKDKTKTKYYL